MERGRSHWRKQQCRNDNELRPLYGTRPDTIQRKYFDHYSLQSSRLDQVSVGERSSGIPNPNCVKYFAGDVSGRYKRHNYLHRRNGIQQVIHDTA